MSEYAVIRREIDAQLDALRLRDAVDVNAPVSAGKCSSGYRKFQHQKTKS
ncbi:MAG: hypothetical protein R3E67_04780 [Pseudomonadales bacterium]